jgi:hypothetical protein
MIIVFGTRLFGKVDEVPGLGHVVTRFFHVYYFPLIPYESFLVLAKSGDQFRGAKIPLSAKSVFVAWLRAGAIVGAVIAGIIALAEFAGPHRHPDWLLPLFTLLIAAGAFTFTKTYHGITSASYARACRLGEQVGLNERGLAELRAVYGEAGTLSGGFEPVMPSAAPSVAMSSPMLAGDSTAPLPLEEGPTSAVTFFVTARDPKQGQDVCVTVWAKDADDARGIAMSNGLLVRQVEPAS